MATGLLAFDGIDTAVTPDEAASNLPITAALVRKWASLGRIQPVDIRGRQKLYRYRDIARCERETRRAAGRHRRMADEARLNQPLKPKLVGLISGGPVPAKFSATIEGNKP